MKNDTLLYEDIIDELDFDPRIDDTDITIAVDKGVITLGGKVKTYLEKELTEQVVKGITGVKAVANELMVDLTAKYKRSDTAIAQTALNALKWDSSVPEDKIQVVVEDGHVILSGEVEWWYQKRNAEQAIRRLIGVKDITNHIGIMPNATEKDVKSHIIKEFHRNAQIDAEKIQVEVKDHKVILKGIVHSWPELEEAIKGAWSAAGVNSVDNKLVISYA